jgi:arginyl-tRNA synthetase
MAAEQYSPALIAAYVYDLVKEFNQYYHDHSILNEPHEATRAFRLLLSAQVARTVRSGMALLGIEVPDRM